MSEPSSQPHGPDLSQGVALNRLADGETLVGHVGDEPVLLVRRGADLLAVASHQGKKLAVATVGRDRDSLKTERAFEQAIGA